jgi:Fur family ferric uptake transcriptional regulator
MSEQDHRPITPNRGGSRLRHAAETGGQVTGELIDSAWGDFEGFLRTRGLRITQTRRIILEHALRRRDHFRAADLVEELDVEPRRVSRGTVYRTLKLLVEAGLLREVRDTDVHVHYEPTFGRGEHEHLFCVECRRFIEFSDPQILARIREVCRRQRFQRHMHRVVVFGRCERCARRAQR